VIIETKTLPDAVRDALKSLGYGRPDIKAEAAESAQLNDYGETGCRSFVCLVDLATGQRKVTYGSWGGPNMFNPRNMVDLDDREQPIPPNAVVICGSEGGNRPVYARLLAHPSTLTPLLPAPSTLSDKLARMLAVYGAYRSTYRAEELKRMGATHAETDELVAGGYLSRNKAGSIQITTKGKQACERVRL